MDEQEIRAILGLGAHCDQGQALHKILGLLVDADLDDHLPGGTTEEEYEQQCNAEIALFKLATAWAAKLKMNRDADVQ